MTVSIIDGGNRSTRRKMADLSLVTDKLITLCCIEYTSSEQDSDYKVSGDEQ